MAYLAGQKLRASDLNIASVSDSDVTSRTTTSTTFTSTLSPATICGTAFTAPPSGKVAIHWATSLSNNSSPNVAQCSPAVRTGSTVGSGTTFQAAGATTAITSVGNIRAGATILVTGLTAGSLYNVALEHRAFSAGTATFLERHVIVSPQIS